MITIIVSVLILVLEWWLGRTDLTKHNSTVDLILGLVLTVIKKIK